MASSRSDCLIGLSQARPQSPASRQRRHPRRWPADESIMIGVLGKLRDLC